MIEQAVIKRDGRRFEKWGRILRFFQVFVLIMLFLGEMLGIIMAMVYWDADRALFWQQVLMLLAYGLPVVAVALALESAIRKFRTEYDYELSGTAFSVYRIVCGRRKWYLSFDLQNVTEIERLAESSDAHRSAQIKEGLCAFCNDDFPDLIAVSTAQCATKGKERMETVLLEPNEKMMKAIARECRSVLLS